LEPSAPRRRNPLSQPDPSFGANQSFAKRGETLPATNNISTPHCRSKNSKASPRAAQALLEKDPSRRFQNPNELLKVEGHFINVYFSLGGNPSRRAAFF